MSTFNIEGLQCIDRKAGIYEYRGHKITRMKVEIHYTSGKVWTRKKPAWHIEGDMKALYFETLEDACHSIIRRITTARESRSHLRLVK